MTPLPSGPVAVILNPAAGGGRAPSSWSRVEPLLRETYADRLQVFQTTRPGEATLLAERAAREGAVAVIAAGGDGTIHEVVNGLMASRDAPALGVLPIGSGNDFARGAGIPLDPAHAAAVLAAAVPRSIDVGQVTVEGASRYFVNVGGVGFDAEVAAYVNRVGKIRRGALPYVAGVLRQLLHYRNAPLRIALDAQVQEATALLVAVGVAPFVGGGMHILPGANPADGRLDICIAGDLRRWEVLLLLPRVFKGTHVRHPKVTMSRATEVRIEGPAGLHVYADGEVLGRVPATFRCLPGALRLLAPPAGPAPLPPDAA